MTTVVVNLSNLVNILVKRDLTIKKGILSAYNQPADQERKISSKK